MSSRPDLRASHSFELLLNLRETVASFAKRESVLIRDFSARRFAATRRHADVVETSKSHLSERTAEAEATFKAEESRVRAIYENRRVRIRRAHEAGLRNLPRRAREVREGWMGELQMRRFNAQQKKAADLEASSLAYAQFSASLALQHEAMLRLQARARQYCRGYLGFLRLLRRKRAATPVAASTQEEVMAALRNELALARSRLNVLRRLPVPRVFSFLPLPIFATVILLIAALVPIVIGGGRSALEASIGFGCILAGALAVVHHAGRRSAEPIAKSIANALAEATFLYDLCRATSDKKRDNDNQRIEQEFADTCESVDKHWARAAEVESTFTNAARERLDAQLPRAFKHNEKLLRPRLSRIESNRAARLQYLQDDAAREQRDSAAVRDAELTQLDAEEKTRWDALETAWGREILPVCRDIAEIKAAAVSPELDAAFAENWQPPAQFPSFARFAQLRLDLALSKCAAIPKDPRLALPIHSDVSLPVALSFPVEGSLLLETSGPATPALNGALNTVILRLLASTPPGKIAFTIIDPVGLGQHFAGFMHLADYEESLINRRIWTQRDQIEERLGELAEHIEKVIQMYLRNEYATIAEYNEKAGSVAEKYHFLVVADFPSNFSELAAKRLQSIAASGPRCGIHTLIHWNNRYPLPDGFSPAELRKNSVCITTEGNALVLDKRQSESGASLILDPPPDPELAARLIHKIGKSSIDSNRVEVPFTQIAPKPSELWTNDTTSELRIAIGRTGATKHQFLAIGKGTRQHALFAGKTGSGKSTLFHVIITNLALACSPDQVEFYLVDFKKGVEFKCYAAKQLPHARVVAIESDREFGLSVLQRVDEELKRRGDLFRKLGVQDVAGYKRVASAQPNLPPMPRSLLIIDEFQEFFIEDDAVSQAASMLFDRIVRQGRAFGIHVLLGSQTLGGAYSLARATLGQMVIRVALQCNEADAYLIMDDSNPAPRLLSRPGEGIYNDAAGAIEGNSPFQVVWLPDEERDQWLDRVHALAEERHETNRIPIVFEGNAPADIRENAVLASALNSAAAPASAARAWLGAPNSIKGPTEAVFHRQSGNNLLIVGQRDETALTLLGLSAIALASQFPPGACRILLLHAAVPGSAEYTFVERLATALPNILTLATAQDISQILDTLDADLKSRTAGEAPSSPSTFLLIHGIQKFRKLRQEDEFSFSSSDTGPSPGAQFNEILTEGAANGIHVLASIDTLNSINRFMNRKALSEFGMRVLFQMGANDSAGLIDTPAASGLGLHRALFYNEHQGHLETFRPYAAPSAEWLTQAAQKLSARQPKQHGAAATD